MPWGRSGAGWRMLAALPMVAGALELQPVMAASPCRRAACVSKMIIDAHVWGMQVLNLIAKLWMGMQTHDVEVHVAKATLWRIRELKRKSARDQDKKTIEQLRRYVSWLECETLVGGNGSFANITITSSIRCSSSALWRMQRNMWPAIIGGLWLLISAGGITSVMTTRKSNKNQK